MIDLEPIRGRNKRLLGDLAVVIQPEQMLITMANDIESLLGEVERLTTLESVILAMEELHGSDRKEQQCSCAGQCSIGSVISIIHRRMNEACGKAVEPVENA